MPNYQDGKIYTIRCRTDNTLIYVGSTSQPLTKRWGDHKNNSKCIKYQNILLYKTINNNWDDWYIELYEDYPCENREQLNKREGEIIRDIGTLNIIVAGRTRPEYFIECKETIAEKRKTYYQNNKEITAQRNKEYREDNKQYISQHMKEYYEQHKEQIKEQKSEQIKCECGCIIRRGSMTRHKKSLNHIQLLENI
jgi:hypothetical protein